MAFCGEFTLSSRKRRACACSPLARSRGPTTIFFAVFRSNTQEGRTPALQRPHLCHGKSRAHLAAASVLRGIYTPSSTRSSEEPLEPRIEPLKEPPRAANLDIQTLLEERQTSRHRRASLRNSLLIQLFQHPFNQNHRPNSCKNLSKPSLLPPG